MIKTVEQLFCSIEGCNGRHRAKGLCKKHYDEQYHEYNAKYHKQWRESHKEERAKYNNQHYQDNKAHYLEQCKQYRKDNKEYYAEYRKINKKYISEYDKQYRQTPAGKLSAKASFCTYRTLLKGLTKVTLTTVQRVYEDNIKQYGTLTCVLCGKPVEFKDSSLEHLTPVSRGGSNDYDNLGVAHYVCNIKKGTKTLEEWFGKIKEATI